MRRTLIIVFLLSAFPLSLFATEEPVSIRFRVETHEGSLFNGAISVSACPDSDTASTTSVNAFCAVEEVAATNGWDIKKTWYSFGASLDSLSNYNADFANNRFWLYFINGEPGNAALNAYLVKPGDDLLLVYGVSPLKLAAAENKLNVGATTTVSLSSFDFTAWAWVPAFPSKLVVDGVLYSESTDGSFGFSPLGSRAYNLIGRKEGFLDSNAVSVTGLSIEPNRGEVLGATVSESVTSGGCWLCFYDEPKREEFDLPKALEFLEKHQSEDGSFGSPMLSDWAAIALSSHSTTSPSALLLKKHLLLDKITSNILTDYERRVMAMLALGFDPRQEPGEYISYIKNSFKDGQFGDPSLINDDIFAVLVLRKAGFLENDEQIEKTVRNIIASQSSNGSWISADLTSAALQALLLTPNLPNVSSSIIRAQEYLRSVQFDDGGYGDVFATSWVTLAVAASGLDPSLWVKNGKSPLDYLNSEQRIDGGMRTDSNDRDSRIWATSYAISAASKKSWSEILGEWEIAIEDTKAEESKNIASSTNDFIQTESSGVATIVISNPAPVPAIDSRKVKSEGTEAVRVEATPLTQVNLAAVAVSPVSSESENFLVRLTKKATYQLAAILFWFITD